MKIGSKVIKNLSFRAAIAIFACTTCFSAVNAYEPFDEMYKHMRYLSQRDSLLAKNIANADTPGYKAQDMAKQEKAGPNAAAYITNPGHIPFDDYYKFDVFDSSREIKPNGNTVNLESELFKKSENSMQLTESMNAYSKAKAALNTAIVGINK